MGENPRFWVAFSIMLLAFALFTIMSVWMTVQAHAEPMPAPPVVHITDDPGGNVGEYYRKYQALNAAGAEVHFHGLCASACGIILFKEFTAIHACADDGTIFGFHKPFEEHGGKINRSKSAVRDSRKLWTAWLAELPDPLRNYLRSVRVPSAAEGDEPNVMLMLPGKLLLPHCPMTVAAQ
ncbi:hypothetical protein EN866_32855 [Mesorhizobium sp. M2D.F.Ca.ET.223.01.1.1]|uniref:hypothetical protein n=1 Tax=Mesorhizobium sp. M2D.F.Ca.ET.223.01.1.1 TaxID=2563940 RepID=UPI0010930386|nr:hypothetical protein [Mesorhizobium sp. M2D.F.Ca.ET.223.01.1.1]TGR84598.1 hypothetical protein EN866_32855 [Mesorhizobium sp. M2D.F.Ca.ET.223.01.1.1]TGT64294.1 hypothetical protein EN802_32920 [bacterium M00.F.Ca.ET.159.01.1.1]TGT79230.1 hypothetical protein EN800_32265 [bacterium M00.F.Ca.ET.157.01.1.1]